MPDNAAASSLPSETADDAGRRFSGKRYLHLGLSIILSALSQLLLKRGAKTAAVPELLGLSALHSGWVWLGILFILGSLFSWLFALRAIPLSVAFTLSGAIHVLVPLGSWVWLGEEIPAKRWCGIMLVTFGVLISARPATVVEEKL
jgi:drug/metabolite transporter (DMT)-like permease